jgi:hypothetical protein
MFLMSIAKSSLPPTHPYLNSSHSELYLNTYDNYVIYILLSNNLSSLFNLMPGHHLNLYSVRHWLKVSCDSLSKHFCYSCVLKISYIDSVITHICHKKKICQDDGIVQPKDLHLIIAYLYDAEIHRNTATLFVRLRWDNCGIVSN